MKKIGYYFKNLIDAIEKVLTFSKEEGFEAIDLQSLTSLDEIDLSWIAIITDSPDDLSKFNIKDIPLVIAGSTTSCNQSQICYNISKNFNNFCLRGVIDIIYHGGVIESFNSASIPEYIKKVIKVYNDIENVDKIVYSLTKDFIYFFKISEVQKLRIGISEILTNAIEHGNLEISGEEKFEATENGTYQQLIQERLNNKKYKDRYVTLTLEISNNQVTVIVEDMGNGFDTSTINTNTSPEENLLKLHGRGILITKMYFDEIIYNEKGNKATLIKKINQC